MCFSSHKLHAEISSIHNTPTIAQPLLFSHFVYLMGIRRQNVPQHHKVKFTAKTNHFVKLTENAQSRYKQYSAILPIFKKKQGKEGQGKQQSKLGFGNRVPRSRQNTEKFQNRTDFAHIHRALLCGFDSDFYTPPSPKNSEEEKSPELFEKFV